MKLDLLFDGKMATEVAMNYNQLAKRNRSLDLLISEIFFYSKNAPIFFEHESLHGCLPMYAASGTSPGKTELLQHILSSQSAWSYTRGDHNGWR